MLVISRTPVRISFFGGGTDYPDYYLDHSGAVLGTTIDQYVHISIKTLQSAFFDHNIRIAYSKTELVKSVEEILHPSVRESLKYKGINGKLDIHFFADLPAKSGLGSSSSCTVGLLNALAALEGKFYTKVQLAQEACHVEQHLIGENVGSQDQFHAAVGGLNVYEFGRSGVQIKPLDLNQEKKSLLQEHLLVFYTGMTRFASEVVSEQLEKTKQRVNDGYLHRMKEMVYEAQEMMMTLPSDKMVEKIGRLLRESWELKKQLSTQISNSAIDEAYDAAIRAGAYGGKLCGAGSGGFLAFFVPEEKRRSVRKALSGLQEVDFHFEDQGSTIIYMKS